VSETQPFKPENSAQFERLAFDRRDGVATSKKTTMVTGQEGKENDVQLESLEVQLKRLETENRILKLQQENALLKQQLTGAVVPAVGAPPPPPHHRQSYPPSSHSESRVQRENIRPRPFDGPFCEDERCFGPPRHSYPPAHREHTPPHCDGCSHRSGNNMEREHGDYHEHHGRCQLLTSDISCNNECKCCCALLTD